VGQLTSSSNFCLSWLRGKNPQKVDKLLPHIGAIAGEHPVGLSGQFGPPISMAGGKTCRSTITRRAVLGKLRHKDFPFRYSLEIWLHA
jgi:hypothetical protein